MRVPLDDVINEIKFRLENNKDGLRAKINLQEALKAMEDYKRLLEQKKL
ncbi:MAG: hypothetical protein PHH08_05095 [Candidatus ainarchaeum sp.]|nr:hypothetical protein [Candidatus ainarchaeum sp.]